MIHLSPAAVRELNRIQSRQSSQKAWFRLEIQPGGCLDCFYSMTFDEVKRSDDRTLECEGLQVAIDRESWSYVEGLTIDYSEDLMGGGFRFYNPQATQTCGCGNSFSASTSGKNALESP